MNYLSQIICAVLGSSLLSTIASAIITGISNKRKIHKDVDNNISKGLEVLLEDRITSIIFKNIDKGWVYLEDKDRVKRMWNIYHFNLKGNGYLDDAMKLFDKLPVKLRGGENNGLEKHS